MHEAKPWMVKQMLDVRSSPGAEVVDGDHGMAFVEERVGKVRADKSSPTGYHTVSRRAVSEIH
jgi:hypothetical protein